MVTAATQVAHGVKKLANLLCPCAKVVYVLIQNSCTKPMVTAATQVAHGVKKLANLLCPCAKVVYVLGIPERK